MTKDSVKEVLALQQECETFNDLTVEQLLYAAIQGTDLEDVTDVLLTTEWRIWCPNVKNEVFVTSFQFQQLNEFRNFLSNMYHATRANIKGLVVKSLKGSVKNIENM